jgi:hypothetical protein
MSDAKKMKSEFDRMQYLYNAPASAWMRAPVPPTPEQIAADPRVRAAIHALESAQESIATFMGVHHYPMDSGAGEVLEEINAALAAFPAQGGET